jgi:mono/diheme cytochrome c family protein
MQTRSKHPVRFVVLAFLVASAAACGGGEGPPGEGASTGAASVSETDLTADELEFGIGPIRNLRLGDIDPLLASAGEEVFALKCSACHRLDERYIGPALGDVTQKRTPEYVMNMILNPEEMVERHPEAKKLFAEFNFTPMANQQLTEDDARAVLEYLRQAGSDDPGTEN